MEDYLRKNFAVEPKRPSEEALRRWRSAVALVKNRSRRFRMVADLAKRAEADRRRKIIQEKIRVALYVQKAALNFIDAGKQAESKLPEDVRKAGFHIGADELASIVRSHDMSSFEEHGGVEGLAKKVSVSLTNGVVPTDISFRQNIYGNNKFDEKPARSFWMFVWEALHDLTLIILIVCAVVSIGVGVATEGWPGGLYDGLGIVLCIFLVVFVTAISDYKQSLQFKDLDKEKKNILVQVTREGCRQKISIYDLVVGDIVHLSIGDQVPADGVLISGYSLSIDESSLSGESEPVKVTQERPFLLSGTKVQDGSGKMLVTTVGMRTEWGRLMVTLSEGGVDETPLQVKLNGVATVIGKIGLVFAVLTFLVLTIRFMMTKAQLGEIEKWGMSDVLVLLNFFAVAVTIIVVAVPEGLPLAVTLSLAFAMKKLMSDKALVRHLSACETMGSATCICTDKTGTLTTNHMVVDKIWTCGRTISIAGDNKREDVLRSSIAGEVLDLLLQSIFQNTGAEVVKGKDGKNNILGSPTETAILEFGLLLGGEFKKYRKESTILKVEPFNSEKKRMSVLVSLSNGGENRAFCKGASEIILESCNKVINVDGKAEHLSKEQKKYITDVINGFACEALRTLCLAFKDVKDTSDVHSDSIPQENYTLIAVIGIKDPVRPGVRQAVETCLSAGIKVRIVTGDNINTAKAIARECGILTENGLAIEGPEFRDMSPRQMEETIPKLQVLARSLPLDKHKLVTYLRKEFKEVVAVTGDGTNDAPALHEADIGLAMGIAGTEVAKENADVIIMDDNFATIQNVARWGRAVYINIQKFVQFQLTVNIVALMLNFVTACISGSAPLTAVQLLWVNMIMDTLGALALATEPPHEGLMKRPPIGRDVAFITRVMWRNIIGQTIYQLIVLAILKFDGERLLKISGSNATAILNTLIFNSFVFCQVFNEINSRDMEKKNVFRGFFDSWLFIMVMVCTVGFQSIIVELLGTVADTVPLSWELWLTSILLGAGSLIVAVILKCIPVENCKEAPMHSLGYLYFLEACTAGPVTKEQAGSYVLMIARFITSCIAEQIRLAPDKFITVCKRFKDQVLLLEEPLRGVAPMLTAIRKLQSSSEHLTALHPEFLLLCLLSRCYKAGLSILEEDVFEVDQPRDLFLFCYYGGMISIGQKWFQKALELLHNVVTAPMSTVNAIAVEAFKKYILVSLIHHGQSPANLPKYASSVAQRNLKNLCQPYIELANSYSNGKIADIETYVEANKDKFESDNNLGLVKQAVLSMYKRNIQRLTQTYLTLSLQDIANRVQLNSPKEAEMHVLQMIKDGEIYATINQKDGMVRFLEDPEQYKTCEMIEHIDSSIQRCTL